MSKLWQGLFGGGTSTTKPKDLTPPELRGLRQPFADAIKGLIGGGSSLSGIPNYKGPLFSPMTSSENTLLKNLMNYNSQSNPTSQNYLDSVIRGKYLPGQKGQNPFLDAAIRAAQRPTMEGLTETLDRTLPGRFTQAGQFVQPHGSSAFDRAAALATRGASQSMADIASQMSSGAYETERGRQQQAVQLSQQQVQTTIANLQAQALPRLIKDLGITRGMEQFQARLQALLQALNIAGSGSTPVIAPTSNTNNYGGLVPGFANMFPRGP